MPELIPVVTRYTFNAHPDPSSVNHRSYAVDVELVVGDTWRVHHLGLYLTADGDWSVFSAAVVLPFGEAMAAGRAAAESRQAVVR